MLAYLAVADGALEALPRRFDVAEEVVQVDEVEVLGAETLERPVDSGLRVGVFGGPNLGSQPDVLALDAALLYSLADLALVEVAVGGVYVPVTGLEGGQDAALSGPVGGKSEGAEAEGGHFCPVVEG